MQAQKMDLSTIKINELINFTGAMIKFDNTDLIQSAKEITAKYQTLIVTEDLIPSIKKEVAGLNKLVTQLEDQRKSIKNTYNEPYNTFENKIKEVTSVINSTVINLKQQLDVFEQKRKEQKKLDVQKIINQSITNSGLWPKYAQRIVFYDKYLNVSESLNQIKLAIDDQILNLLESQNHELEAERLRLELEETKKAEQKAKLIARLSLINHLQNKYEIFGISYDETSHLSDIQLHEYFENKLAESLQKLEAVNELGEQLKEPILIDAEQIAAQLFSGDESISSPLPIKTCYNLTLSNIKQSELDEIVGGIKEYYPHIIINIE